MTSSAPTIPPPFKSHLNYIPAPSPSEFDSEFGGFLPEGSFIPSSWGSTRYYSFHPSSTPKRRIIILHGGGAPALGIAPLAFKLTAAGNHVIAYDLWSHGLSSTPLTAHTPALFHQQLLELLSHLQWTSAHLLGFSAGGSIATSFTALHPKAVESLTLIAPAGLLRKSERSWIDTLILEGGWGREWLSRRKIMDFVHGRNLQVKPGWKERLLEGEVDTVVVEKWEREKHRGHVAGIVSMFRHGGVYDEHESYRLVQEMGVKVLVILGEKDQVFEPAWMKVELGKLGWTSDIHVIPGATHALVRSHDESIVELVEHFHKHLERERND